MKMIDKIETANLMAADAFKSLLNITEVVSFPEGSNRICRRGYELLGNVTVISGLHNRANHRRVIDLLLVI